RHGQRAGALRATARKIGPRPLHRATRRDRSREDVRRRLRFRVPDDDGLRPWKVETEKMTHVVGGAVVTKPDTGVVVGLGGLEERTTKIRRGSGGRVGCVRTIELPVRPAEAAAL